MCLLSLLYAPNTSRHTYKTVEECHLDSISRLSCFAIVTSNASVCCQIFGHGADLCESINLVSWRYTPWSVASVDLISRLGFCSPLLTSTMGFSVRRCHSLLDFILSKALPGSPQSPIAALDWPSSASCFWGPSGSNTAHQYVGYFLPGLFFFPQSIERMSTAPSQMDSRLVTMSNSTVITQTFGAASERACLN